jgi:hypothetical protein
MEKKTFSINATTKEQYLKFKETIKKGGHTHAFYVAYYIFKHRIGEDHEIKLRDNLVIEKYVDEVVVPACHKGLYHGYIGHCGGDCISYGIRNFKADVIYYYNAFAEMTEDQLKAA